jgi:hypothetical protein
LQPPRLLSVSTALQTIFSFFLGLMVLAFIGVGVNTFYQSPAEIHEQQVQDLQRQRDELNVQANGRTLGLPTGRDGPTDRRAERLRRTIDQEQKAWARVNVILVVFATIVMSVSLVRSEQLRVLGNGLLLGGLFTMIYGVGWVIFSGNSVARFAVMAFALVVAIGLGYAKFVGGRAFRCLRALGRWRRRRCLAVLEARVSALRGARRRGRGGAWRTAWPRQVVIRRPVTTRIAAALVTIRQRTLRFELWLLRLRT